MEPGEFIRNSRNSYSENRFSRSRDRTLSNNGNQWREGYREHQRDYGNNRGRGQDGEWIRDRAYHGTNRENFRYGDSRDPLTEQLERQLSQKTSTFSAYDCNTSDLSYFGDNPRSSMLSTDNALDSDWRVNPMDSIPMTRNNLPVIPGSSAMPSGTDMTQPSGLGMHPFTTFISMLEDNMYEMMKGQENVTVDRGPMKKGVQLTKGVLYPPYPNAPLPATQSKPLGCKTVIVGGLPEKATEEIIKEVFGRCGEILIVQMINKNVCQIRFANESFVENAIHFSGYILKIEDKNEAPFVGRLHVDYAQVRDHEYDYGCQQAMLQLQHCHGERAEQVYYTPSSVVPFSEHEAIVLSEKLRGEDTFQQALFVLTRWLERGECNKKNAALFYSMIQSTNHNIRQLMNEKLRCEEQLTKAKMMLKQQMQGNLVQLNDIEKVFNAACVQKVWDHFTKSQRKNVDTWKKEIETYKNAHVKEVLNDRIEDEMDLSSDDGKESEANTVKISDGFDAENNRSEEICRLREEVDSLRRQLEAAENEVKVVQAKKSQELDFKDCQIQGLKRIAQTYVKVNNLSQKHSLDEAELKELRTYKLKRNLEENNDNSELDNDNLGATASTSTSANAISNENEVRLIGLISTFLHVHPFGASIDYICSYLHQIDSTIKVRDVDSLMKRFPSVFREDSFGIGACLGKKWRFLGFQS